MRRAILVVLLAAIVAGSIWTVITWKGVDGSSPDPWKAVPSHAVAVLEVTDAWSSWDHFTHTSLLWRALEKRRIPAAMARVLERCRERTEQDAALKATLGHTVLVALVRNGEAGAAPVIIGTVSSGASLESLGQLVGIEASSQQQFTEGVPTTALLDKELSPMSFAVQDGVWILAQSEALVEEALAQLRNGTPITSDTLFARAKATLGHGAEAHVLVRTSRLMSTLQGTWSQATVDQLDAPDAWVALDLLSQPDALLLSGLMVATQDHPLLNTVAAQGTGPWNIGRVLPADVVAWEVWNVSDADGFLANNSNDATDEVLMPWVSGIAASATATNTNGTAARRWLVLEAGDVEEATQDFNARCASSPADTLNYRGIRLTHFPTTLPWERLVGRKGPLPQRPWFIALGRQIILSDDPDALRASIDVWNDGNSLAENRRAMDWFLRMSDDATATWWCDVARGNSLLREDMKADVDSATWSITEELSNFSVQLSPAQQGLVHVSIGLQHSPKQAVESNVLWSCAIDGVPARPPFVVVNHTNKTNELLLQDTLHRIHLVSAAGKVLWTHQLDGAILGSVHQVDRFQNGKLQLLFNTAGTCYLLDRNGKDLAGFPLKLAASAPLAVFDYDAKRDYRVLVNTTDKRVANFGLDGVMVDGWATPKLDEPSSAAVHHLRIRNKDYLVVVDGNGGIRILDRKGAERERITTKLVRLKALHAVIAGNDLMATRLVWQDQDLAIHETTLAGEDRMIMKNAERLALIDDLDGDGNVEIVRVHADSLLMTTEHGTGFGVGTGNALQKSVAAYRAGGSSVSLSAAGSTTEKAYLLGTDGRQLPGSPWMGSTPPVLADLNGDGAMEVITFTRGGMLVAYKLFDR